MRFVLPVVMLILLFHSGFSQHYTIRNYKAIDGLPQSQVNIILEDKNGYLWIGTEGGGLARYDGREFKVYTTLDGLASNIISYLKLDSKQNLWIVHPRGITKFDGKNFKKFQQPGIQNNTKRLRRAFEHHDTIFFISAPGHLGKIYNDSVYYWSKAIKPDVLISYAHLTPDKKILLYLSDSTFHVKAETVYSFDHSKYFNRVYGLMFNYQNKVWIRTDSGYFTIDAANKTFNKSNLGITESIVFYDSINNCFWGRDGSTLLKLTLDDEGKVKRDTVLTEVNIRQILVDAEGNTWFATSGSGLFKYFIQDFDRCSSERMRGIMAIHKDRTGATWIGSSSRGLLKMKKGKITSYFNQSEPYRNMINSISESPTGEIWIGTTFGLGKYDPQTDKFKWFTREHGLSSASISGGIQFDKNGGMWIGSHSGGLNYFDGNTFQSFSNKQGIKSNSVTALNYSPYHDMLFVGDEFGVYSFKNFKANYLPITDFQNTAVLSISSYKDSLMLFASAGAGVAVYNLLTRSRKMITTHQGLPSDFIYFIVSDEEDYIWIGSEKGITRIKLDNELNVIENIHYDHNNGLSGVETNQNAYYISNDEKYFGLIDGLYQFNKLSAYKPPFKLHLTDIEILFGQYATNEFSSGVNGFFKIPTDLKLPTDLNHVTFHFNKVNKRYPKSIKFKFFLENFDKRWSQPSSSNEVTYSNVPPGNYVFRLKATNGDGSWDPEELTYAFTIKVPFYQTTAFILGVIILLAGGITLIIYIRVKQRINHVMMLERIRAKEQETLRKEIARDFHDEMGNQLTRIINYVSLLKLSSGNNGHTENGSNGHRNIDDLYTKVENSAKYLYTGTRDFIWSIDPGNDELSRLFIHIRDFGEKLFEEKEMNFRANNEVKELIKLPYGFSREANLIFKEAMTNAFKYSNAANITFTLTKIGEGFEFTLEDDGMGFQTADVQKLNGLKNIRARAERINAILRIHSVKDVGTKIVLNFKLTKSLKYGLAL